MKKKTAEEIAAAFITRQQNKPPELQAVNLARLIRVIYNRGQIDAYNSESAKLMKKLRANRSKKLA